MNGKRKENSLKRVISLERDTSHERVISLERDILFQRSISLECVISLQRPALHCMNCRTKRLIRQKKTSLCLISRFVLQLMQCHAGR